MTPIERIVLWIVAAVALLLAGYNFVAGRQLTTWANDALLKWAVHTTAEATHSLPGPPSDHAPPPPPPPW